MKIKNFSVDRLIEGVIAVAVIFIIAAICFLPIHAHAQTPPPGVHQHGSVTAGHGATWFGNNTIQDGGSATSTSYADILNNVALILPHHRAAFGAVLAGQSNEIIVWIGDSTMMGAFSNNAASGNWRLLAVPSQFTAMLSNQGVNASSQAFSGFGGFSTDLTVDARLTIGSSWTQSSSTTTGGKLLCATTTTNALSFLPVDSVDTFIVYYPTNTGNGTFSIDINGAGTTSYSQNSSPGFTSQTITGSLGANTLNIKYVSGGQTCITGIVAYNSAIKQVISINAGWDGATAGNWNTTTNPWSSGNSFINFGQSLTVINLGINNWFNSTGVSTYTADMQALITQALTVGDVLLVAPNPTISTAPYTQAVQAQYIAAMKALAVSNNVPIVDIFDRWVSYAVSNPLGFYYPGGLNLHPQGQGYADITQAIYNFLNESGTAVSASGGSGKVNSGSTGQVAYYGAGGTAVSGNANLFANSTQVGIGTVTPSNPLSINAGSGVFGMDIKSSNTTALGFALNNTSSHQFALTSEGSASADPGCFAVADNTANKNPFNVCGTNKTVGLLQSGVLAWSTAASFVSSTYDVGISRVAADVLAIGTSAGGDTTGFLKAGGIIIAGTKYTITGCGFSAPSGGATAGAFTSGTTGTCTVVITINGATGLTSPNGMYCDGTDITTGPAKMLETLPASTTQCTLTGTTVSGDVITFIAQPF